MKHALVIVKKVHNEEHPKVAEVLNNIAELLREQVSRSASLVDL